MGEKVTGSRCNSIPDVCVYLRIILKWILQDGRTREWLDITQGRAVSIDFFFEPRVRLEEELGLVSPGVGHREMCKIKNTKRYNESDNVLI